jgi:hypothetical protein
MRGLLFGALVGAVLVIANLATESSSEPAFGAQGPSAAVAAQDGAITTHLSGADGQPLTLTVIDPREHWIGVYHIDRSTGEISLKSARNITWDAKLIDFNSGKPLPQDIRSGQQR